MRFELLISISGIALVFAYPQEGRIRYDFTVEDKINERDGVFQQLIEGDIVPSSNEDVQSRRKKSVMKNSQYPKYLWSTDEPVPYFFDDNFPEKGRKVVQLAMDYYTKHTCLRFEENTVKEPRIRIYAGSGCSSQVGKGTAPVQNISLGDTCTNLIGVPAHEIAHSLGFYHTQARTDRDQYIKVHFDNIGSDDVGNFKMEADSDNQNVKFEYGSIMQYATDYFAVDKSKPSMEVLNPLYASTMGNRGNPTFLDVYQINKVYKCLAKCTNTPNVCENGGYPNPNNCKVCECPSGFGGDRCDELQKPTDYNKGCGKVIQTTETWTHLIGEVKTDLFGTNSKPVAEECWWRFEAPEGKQIAFHFTKLDIAQCSSTCNFANVQMKMGNFTETGYRICCQNHVMDYHSDTNFALVGAFSAQGNPAFVLYYRYY